MKKFAIVCFCCAAFDTLAICDEPSEQFLQALRDRQYYDIALDYLEDMETSPLASEDFKRTLSFERAQTLIQSTTRIRDLRLLEKRLQEAEGLLTNSEANAGSPELKARSQNYKGDLLFRRAKIYLNLGDNERLTAGEKEEQYKQARQFLDKALDSFAGAKASYKEILDNYKLDLRDPGSKQRLKRMRGVYTVVRVKLPQILELYADTLDKSNPKRKEFLAEAARNFEQLWLKYPNFPAGLDSCFYAARCKYKLEEFGEALSFLQRVFSLPNNSTLLPLKRRAMVLAADCWSRVKPYPYDDVIANFEPFCTNLTRRDQRNSDWQRIQLELARAYYRKSQDLRQSSPTDGRIRSLNRDAARMIKAIARLPGEHRDAARDLMNDWNLSVESDASIAEQKAPLKTFADAKQRGVDLINEIEALNADISDASRKLQAPGFDNPQQLETELANMRLQLVKLSKQCIAVFEKAIVLRDSETSREDLNQIRYLQSVCYFVQKNYFESALIGEFLVERYPKIAFSKQAGGIALRSYAALYDQAEPESQGFERDQLTRLSNKMVTLWQGSTESADAASTLTRILLAQPQLTPTDIAKIEELMNVVGEDSVERAALAVKLGTKLWFEYRQRKSAKDSDTELQDLLSATIGYLSEGVAAFSRANLRMDVAWGAVFLVNAHLENRDLDKALKQLEQASVSPIDLVKEKNRVISDSGKFDLYLSETYKIAGKTYLAALSEYPGDQQWTDKALAVVRAMQSRANRSGDEKSRQDVLNIYRLIAVELDRQMNSLTDLNQQKLFVKNLNQFLQTLQSESDDPNTIIWSGKTMMDLADSFSSRGMDAEAKPLYQSAMAALQRAASIGVNDPKLLNELKRQQAIAKRGTGDFEAAYKELLELLRSNPNAWQIQIDAAKTLQIWGSKSKQTRVLAKALAGGERYTEPKSKRPKNLVWGWSKLADALKSNSRFANAYYTSLMGAVETRLEYGVIEQNPKVIAAALKRLRFARTKDPELGGENWKPQFDQLEKRIKSQMESIQVSTGKD